MPCMKPKTTCLHGLHLVTDPFLGANQSRFTYTSYASEILASFLDSRSTSLCYHYPFCCGYLAGTLAVLRQRNKRQI